MAGEETDADKQMIDQHPITPPEELVHLWENETAHTTKDEIWHVAVQAARWGADQELKACCEWVEGFADFGDLLRSERRPKPQSLKEQALLAIDTAVADDRLSSVVASVVRRALEQLDD